MTGIYFGAGSSLFWYLVVWEAHHSGRFRRMTWTLLSGSIAVMAFDGLNSLAMDLALPTPYATSNAIRLVTGLLSGVAIGAFLSHLVTIALTRRPSGGWALSPTGTLAPPLLFGASLCAIAASRLQMLELPLTCLIVASTLAVLWAMMSVLVAIALGRSWGFTSARLCDETLAISLIGACGLLLGLAALRLLLEQRVGPIGLS